MPDLPEESRGDSAAFREWLDANGLADYYAGAGEVSRLIVYGKFVEESGGARSESEGVNG
jgi:hypothetical protein